MNRRQDPLAIDAELSFHQVFHPVGFRLELATNSPHVLEAAAESWPHHPAQSRPGDPLEFRVMVQEEGASCGETCHRAQGHLYSVVSDRDNFAALDLHWLRASIFISRSTAEDHARLRWFFLESLAYMLLAQRHVIPVHAGCVARQGRGLLLCGPTQAGKSTMAYACARAGWSYVSDDAVFLLPNDSSRTVIGRHRHVRFRPDAPSLFPELERFVSRERPNGKISVEVPLEELPHIHPAASAEAACAVLLDRSGSPVLESLPADDLRTAILRDMPSYGPEVNAMHERAVAELSKVPAFRLRYRTLEEALGIIDGLL